MYVQYIFNIYNISVVSVSWEVTHMNFDVLSNNIEVLSMGVWETDFIHCGVHKLITFVLVRCFYIYTYIY